MPDIELRFHRDMLVLSAPVDALLERQGVNVALDRQYLNLMEPDVMRDALKLEVSAGAQCVVTPTEDITRARLAHVRMEGDAPRLARAALKLASEVKPQHVLAEIGPCGLPLDPSSKASLNENRAQYADAARAFGDDGFDAFFLNGFSDVSDLKCALMGVSQVSGKPVIASATVGAANPEPSDGEAPAGSAASFEDVRRSLPFGGYELADGPSAPPQPAALRKALAPELWPAAIEAMVDLGAAVVGFETAEPLQRAVEYTRLAVDRADVPVLAQLRVTPGSGDPRLRGLVPIEDAGEYTPDAMEHAAVRLYAEGAQFLRASGAATPAFTGALAATVQGLETRRAQRG